MAETKLEIFAAQGPCAGTTFKVPVEGARLGRSSSCTISIPDPSLSRNHCLFEITPEGGLTITDLASANGTMVNDEPLSDAPRSLIAGDRIVVGDSSLVVFVQGTDPRAVSAPPAETSSAPVIGTPSEVKVDLGLGKHDEASSAAPEAGKAKKTNLVHTLLWLVTGIIVLVAAGVILFGNAKPGSAIVPVAVKSDEPRITSLYFERVEAGEKGIYRYALTVDEAGTMVVAIDDVPVENRHVRKGVKLSKNARASLEAIFSDARIFELDSEYIGVGSDARSLNSFNLRIVKGTRVFETIVSNTQEPDTFRDIRERLEAFSKNELGIWAIQYSAEKLIELSAEAEKVARAKWDERDVQYGNISAALTACDEAVVYLETVNPKPEGYDALLKFRREVDAELDNRYKEQRFRAERASKLNDWELALKELRVLCEMVPDSRDPRHAEASAKLVDVENRIKKGDAR